MRMKRRLPAAIAACVAAACLHAGAQPRYDLVIRNGKVIDGSGGPAMDADIAIADGRIVRMAQRGAASAAMRIEAPDVIDATGLTIAPGFIDVHTHGDDLAQHPDAENFVRGGVTSIVAGNCGASAIDIGEALAEIQRRGAAINFATLVGHNTVRREVMGLERRPPTAAELGRMKAHVWRAMVDGASGFSTGLQYVPGVYADAVEITELARVAGRAGGVYASHMRNEGTEIEKSIAETLAVGTAAGARVQISHLKIDSPKRWGASVAALQLIDAARARGVDVLADQYVYTAASSSLSIRFPAWALEGGADAIARRLDDGPTWERIRQEMKGLLEERGLSDYAFATVAHYRPDPSIQGLTVKQVAAKWKGTDTLDAQLEAARQMQRAGGAQMVYHFMSEEDVSRIAAHRGVAFASDASLLTPGAGVPHPRGYGNAARVLGEYVRARGVLSIEEAVRKMTSLPAAHFRLPQRGAIRAGYAADLVVFDARTIRDTATFEAPHSFPEGIRHVFVNGRAVVRDGRGTSARPGQVLRPASAVPMSVAEDAAGSRPRHAFAPRDVLVVLMER